MADIEFQSAAIFVNNVIRARVFYETELGLTVGRAGSWGFQLFDDPPHVTIHPANHPDSKHLVGRHTGITFKVQGLLNLCQRLTQHGVKFVTDPTQQGFGIMALVADPEDNVVALWEDNTEELDKAEKEAAEAAAATEGL